jgi:hypothetical protein
LATLPDLAKMGISMMTRSGPSVETPGGLNPALLQAVDLWLRASNITAAKEAMGDLTGALRLQSKIDEAGKTARAKAEAEYDSNAGKPRDWDAVTKAEKAARKAAADGIAGFPK